MNEEKMFNAVSGIDEELLDRSLTRKTRRSPRSRFRWGVAAVCLAVIIAISSTALTLAAEAKEYNTALDFFAENGLSAEGLSRSDVKAVYRDITQKKFTYEKTEEVIRRIVPGVEIEQRALTPEELAALWNERNNTGKAEDGNKIRFAEEMIYEKDKQVNPELEKCVLKCYRGDELLWNAEFTDFYVRGELYTGNGTAVWGRNSVHSSDDVVYGWIALVNDEGEIEWQHRLEHGFKSELITSVLQNEDGTFEVFSRGDYSWLCLSRYDPNGNECRFVNTGVNCDTAKAARLGDGYIVRTGSADLIRLDKDGNMIDGFTYEADDCSYYLQDMTEYAGQIYISAYAVPKQQNSVVRGGYVLSDVLVRVSSYKDRQISSEELTPMIQDNFTAVLLLCDPKSGAPQTFYSVKGSLGYGLSVNDAGQLEWRIESIVSTSYSPFTSAFTFGGISEVYVYTFGADGDLIGETDTGTQVAFLK